METSFLNNIFFNISTCTINLQTNKIFFQIVSFDTYTPYRIFAYQTNDNYKIQDEIPRETIESTRNTDFRVKKIYILFNFMLLDVKIYHTIK